MNILLRAEQFVAVYGLLTAAVLIALIVNSSTGHEVTGFMWGRSGGVFASAIVTYWPAVLAARGKRWAYLRLRIISVTAPIVLIINRSALRAAFREAR